MGEPSDFRAAAGRAPICLVRLRPYVAGLLAVFAIGCAPAAAPGPSLIVVVIDTLRSDHLSLYGYPHPTTPNLDALAHDAVVFVRCLATSPWTLPSTLSLLSGLYPERHGVESAVGQRQVSQDVELLAERLAARGYRTAAFSENPYISPIFGVDQGFDHFGYSLAFGAHIYRDLTAPVGEARDWLAEHLSNDREAPFFLYLHVMNVHGPYLSSDEHRQRFLEEPNEPFEFQSPLWGKVMSGRCAGCREEVTDAHLNDLRARYDGAIAHTDAVLGEFFDELRADGVLDRSVLVVVSDHGEELFEHGGFGHGKSLHREILDVPLLIRPPGGVAPRRVTEPVSLVDLPATALDLLGIPLGRSGIGAGDGISLAPLLEGRPLPVEGPRTLIAQLEAARRGSASMIQRWPWRAIATERDYRGRSGVVELFDLERDPGERDDRAAAEPARLAEMLAELRETQRGLAAARAAHGPSAASTPELERRLEALGYLDEPKAP